MTKGGAGMDLMAIAARLFLDRGEYDSGLEAAEAAASAFAEGLDETLTAAEAAATAAMNGIGRGFSDGADDIIRAADGAAGEVSDVFSALARDADGWGRDMMQSYNSGIMSMWGTLQRTVSDVAGLVKSYLGFSEPEAGPLSDFHTYAPDMMKLFSEGIEANGGLIADAVDRAFDLRPRIVEARGGGVGAVVETPRQESPKALTVVLELDGAALGRAVYALNNREAQRVGVKLAKGMV